MTDLTEITLTAATVLNLQQGDIIALRIQGSLNTEHIERIREHMAETFPGHRCLVLEEGADISVLRP